MGWMADLPNDMPLHEVVMPGSHDAGLWETTGAGLRSGHVVTQLGDVAFQLNAGCRFFDFRVFNFNTIGKTKEGDLRFGHFAELTGRGNSAIGRFGPKLVPALQQVATFLSNNDDLVILRFSHINKSNGPPVVAAVKKHLGNYLYKSKTTSLGSAKLRNLAFKPMAVLKGKCLAIFDIGDKFAADATHGIHLYKSHKQLWTLPALADTLSLQLCGDYSNESSYSKMSTKQAARNMEHKKHCLNHAQGAIDHLFMMYFTFTSGVKNIKSMTEPNFAKLDSFLDMYINPRAAFGGPNIIMMDFINDERCQKVITRGLPA